jgi:hypothetical protein
MKFFRLIFPCAAILLFVLPAAAQNQPQSPEQQEKQMMEYIDKEVKRLTDILDLEYWQEFYVDSTLTHDLHAMSDEIKSLQSAKVENSDLYMGVRDKWMEQIDVTYKRIFNEAQWKKYWKSGGQRAQRERDKRKK